MKNTIILILLLTACTGARSQPIVDYGPQVHPARTIFLSHVAFSGPGRGTVSKIAHVRFNPPTDGTSCRRAVFMMPETAYTQTLLRVLKVGDIVGVYQDYGDQQAIVNSEGYLTGFKNQKQQREELELLAQGQIGPAELQTLYFLDGNLLQFVPGVDEDCESRLRYLWVEPRFPNLGTGKK